MYKMDIERRGSELLTNDINNFPLNFNGFTLVLKLKSTAEDT
jgi:hypothetical protein